MSAPSSKCRSSTRSSAQAGVSSSSPASNSTPAAKSTPVSSSGMTTLKIAPSPIQTPSSKPATTTALTGCRLGDQSRPARLYVDPPASGGNQTSPAKVDDSACLCANKGSVFVSDTSNRTAFDFVAMVISTSYLWKFSNSSRASFTRLTRMMLEDGIMYLIVLSGINIINLVFFQSRDTMLQSAA
ncbi:hypothetical protein C8F04DRAFT_1294875 [Mycena alexandri]|uniref:Uncharacterized protein n=1 Tax=Mycena alexandri TaxID=1745969 RepID=A0AAD6WTY5_9AGAR|nr:hypothetical protein C8F04DRAFT_1294875 [Mycena alexandri]